MGWGEWRKAVVVGKEKCGSRMSGEGLDLGRVGKNKMILRVLNIERVEAGTCSSWSEGGCGDGG
jgi:hypothetical protein